MSFAVSCPRCAWSGRRRDFAGRCPGCGHFPLVPRMREVEDFQPQVTGLATLCGWTVYHTRDSRGSNKGLPDLLLLRERTAEALYAELKVPPRTVTPEQAVFMELLRRCGQRVYLWRPADLDGGEIQRVLR